MSPRGLSQYHSRWPSEFGSWGPGPSGVFHLPFPSPVLSCESFYSAYFVLEMSLLERMQTGLFVLKLVNCWRKKNICGWSLRWPQCLGLRWEVGVQEVLRRLTHRSRTMWNDNDTFIGVSGDMREGEGVTEPGAGQQGGVRLPWSKVPHHHSFHPWGLSGSYLE